MFYCVSLPSASPPPSPSPPPEIRETVLSSTYKLSGVARTKVTADNSLWAERFFGIKNFPSTVSNPVWEVEFLAYDMHCRDDKGVLVELNSRPDDDKVKATPEEVFDKDCSKCPKNSNTCANKHAALRARTAYVLVQKAEPQEVYEVIPTEFERADFTPTQECDSYGEENDPNWYRDYAWDTSDALNAIAKRAETKSKLPCLSTGFRDLTKSQSITVELYDEKRDTPHGIYKVMVEFSYFKNTVEHRWYWANFFTIGPRCPGWLPYPSPKTGITPMMTTADLILETHPDMMRVTRPAADDDEIGRAHV